MIPTIYVGISTKPSVIMGTEAGNDKDVLATSNVTEVNNVSVSCEKVVQPNGMVYFDESGERHEIYLPKGTYQKAVDLLQGENWEELSKFPVYPGQGYEEWD